MKPCILFLIFTLFQSCIDYSKFRTGKYESYIAPNNYNIVLLKNNRFQYSMTQDIFGDLKVKGTWQKKLDTIILQYDNIPPKFVKGSIEIQYLENSHEDSIFIQIIDSLKCPLQWIGPLILDGQEYNILNNKSKVYIKPQKIDTIKYKYIGNTEPISLGLNKVIDQNILVKVIPNYERPFIYDMLPDKLVYRKGKLYFSQDGKTDFRYPYKRIDVVTQRKLNKK